ncbi:hypothetical protein SGLAD_v1c08910 [Spiroplasma gladiatoris]|uniref:Uncharacterized protein n=1 Tax=Spiroplasma gladiatoris TaxID=2143 RepID=A0A4P7AKK5_9MOLU|nr:hypothetical protein [Spiroplasma gladiatoris]QBQ08090.1 hypothetical protein SGLAD_v1c08910 [Spiroplasma gladiatoris]
MKINKNFEFSLKLMVLIGLVSFLAFDFIRLLIAPKIPMTGTPLLERFSHYYAFFTTQSNYLVAIYLFYSLFTQFSYNKKPPFGIELAVTVYISLTMFVFWCGIIFSPEEAAATTRPSDWFTTTVLHLIVPIVMIGNFIISSGDTYYSPRVHAKFSLFGILAYPVCYSFYAIIRGEYRFETYGSEFFEKAYILENGVWKINPNGPWSTDIIAFSEKVIPYSSQMWYPYWFMNLHNVTLKARDVITGEEVVWKNYYRSDSAMLTQVIMGYIIILSLVVIFQYLYLFLNNIKYYRWHDIDGNLITKAERDYWMKVRKFKRQELKNEKRLLRIRRKTEYKEWIQELKILPYKEKIKKIMNYKNQRTLKNGLKRAEHKNHKLKVKKYRQDIKKLINLAKTQDRAFIKQNLRDAARYSKLVKKGYATRRIKDI